MTDAEKIQSLMQACLQNAGELIQSARRIRESGLNNIAYHLASLGLEEIGKATVIVMTAATDASPEQDSPLGKWMEDHTKKLFWAFWAPTFGRERISGEQMREFMDLANTIHETRLVSLYVNPSAYPSRPLIADSVVDNLIAISEGRLALARLEGFSEPDPDSKKDIEWFLSAFNLEKGTFIRTSVAMEKLQELGDSRAWIRWLRETFEEADRESRRLAEKELKRPEPGGTEGAEPKWKLKIRFYSSSHSIRPKPLAAWNQRVEVVKLFPTKDKDQLLVELTLPKRVPIQGVWPLGWRMSRALVGALNIGTFGFFWWYVPTHISRYYEQLIDLENTAFLELERNPALRVSWGHLALKEEDLTRVSLVQAYLISSGADLAPAFDHYTRGLTLLSKNDIYFQCEGHAFDEFFQAFQEQLRAAGDWDGVTSLRDAVSKVFEATPAVLADLGLCLDIAEEMQRNKRAPKELDLERQSK